MSAGMALSVEKLLTDAHSLILRLKDDDSTADAMIGNTRALFLKVEAMKQYQDDITELNEIAKHRPRSTLVLGIAQENRQIRELQQENRELQATLEDHQSALELIMQKYREHTVKLLQSSRIEKALQEKEMEDKNSMCHLMDKIDEMAGVMQKAIEVDDSRGCVDTERLSQLELENRALRELLEICTTSKHRIIPDDPPDNAEKEEEEKSKESASTVQDEAPPSQNASGGEEAEKGEGEKEEEDEEGEETAVDDDDEEEEDSSETDSSECNSTILATPPADVKKESEDSSSDKNAEAVSPPAKKSPDRAVGKNGKTAKDNSPPSTANPAGKAAGKTPATAAAKTNTKKGKAGGGPAPKRAVSNPSCPPGKKDNNSALKKSSSVDNKKADPKTKGSAGKSNAKK